MLKEIWQGENETLRECVERFNKEVLNVRDLTDKMRLYFTKDDLRVGNWIQIDIGANQPVNLEEFLHLTQKFIDYEENAVASQAVGKPTTEKSVQQEEGRPKREQGGTPRIPMFELPVS